MEKKPLISIITINKNNLQGLKRTLESVWGQTWTDFEYMVIDGASTDGSKEYLEENAHNMNHWISEPDTGIYNAMNKGIKLASGEYLLFLNSGDHFLNNNVLQQNHKSLTKFDFIYFDLKIVKEGKEIFIKSYPEKLSFSYFVKDSLPHPSTFIKRSVFDITGLYNEKLNIVSDWEKFIIGICKYNASYKKYNKILSVFYMDGISSYDTSWPILMKERGQVLESQFSLFMEDYKRFSRMERKLLDLRGSRKIQLLIRLNLLNKF